MGFKMTALLFSFVLAAASLASPAPQATAATTTPPRISPTVIVGPPTGDAADGYFHVHDFECATEPHGTLNTHSFAVYSNTGDPQSYFNTTCSNTTANAYVIGGVYSPAPCEDPSVQFTFLSQGVYPGTDWGNWNLTITHSWTFEFPTEYGGTGTKTKVSTGYAYFPGQGDVYDYPDPIIPWYESQYMTVPADFDVPYDNTFAE